MAATEYLTTPTRRPTLRARRGPTLGYALTLPSAVFGTIVGTARAHRPECPARLRARGVGQARLVPEPGGFPQAVRLAGGLYHVLLQPTGSRRMSVRTLTAVDGAGFCVYAVPRAVPVGSIDAASAAGRRRASGRRRWSPPGSSSPARRW